MIRDYIVSSFKNKLWSLVAFKLHFKCFDTPISVLCPLLYILALKVLNHKLTLFESVSGQRFTKCQPLLEFFWTFGL